MTNMNQFSLWICSCGRMTERTCIYKCQNNSNKAYVYLCLGDVLKPTSWMLSIEGQVVVGPHQNIVAGMAVLFSSYYVFNLVYQEEASITLEFIQR